MQTVRRSHERGHAKPVVMLPETGKTSAEAAAGLGCEVAQIAKSILFRRREDDAPVLVIASGANRVDEKKVAAHVGDIGRADAKFVREMTGYAIGGVCPIGHATPPVTLIDASDRLLGELLRSMAPALTTSPWATHPRVLVVGLSGAEGAGIQSRTTLAAALEVATAHAGERAPGLRWAQD